MKAIAIADGTIGGHEVNLLQAAARAGGGALFHIVTAGGQGRSGQGGDGEQHQGQDEAHAVIFRRCLARTRS